MALTTVDQGMLGTNAQYTGFKNRIINGAMQINQRGTSGTITSGNYLVDRFKVFQDTSATLTYTQSTDAPSGFVNSSLITVTSGGTVTSAQGNTFLQQIEGSNVTDLNWGTANAKTVTLSFWVKCSVTGTFGGSITNGSNARSNPFTYTISSANTWEQKSVTIAGDTTGTWVTNTNTCIAVWFSLGTGSTLSGTAGTWATANYISATGATSVVGTNGATFYITGVQLEKGSTATSFDYRPYSAELAMCQRYYQTYGIGNGVGTNTQRCISATNNSGNLIGTWSFIQNMRAAPSATVYGSGTTTGNLVVNYSASSQAIAANTAVTFSSLSVNGWMFNMGSTITANITNWIDMGTATNAGAFTFSAEL
jgi:hypothetical protein